MRIELTVIKKDIPDDIVIIGHASNPPTIGKHFNISVLTKNGIPTIVGDFFTTSGVVRKIKGDKIITKKEQLLIKKL